MKVLLAQSCPTLCDPMVCSLPGSFVHGESPLSMGFSRQECWSGLPFPFPGDLPDSGIEPRSPVLQADSLPFEIYKLIIYKFINSINFQPIFQTFYLE